MKLNSYQLCFGTHEATSENRLLRVSLPSELASSGRYLNVSYWPGPPCINIKITRFARDAKCGDRTAKGISVILAGSILAAFCRFSGQEIFPLLHLTAQLRKFVLQSRCLPPLLLAELFDQRVVAAQFDQQIGGDIFTLILGLVAGEQL